MFYITIAMVFWTLSMQYRIAWAGNKDIISEKCHHEKDFIIIGKSFRMFCNMNEADDNFGGRNKRWTMGKNETEICVNTKCKEGYRIGEEGPYIYLQIDNFGEEHFSNYTFWLQFNFSEFSIDKDAFKIYSYPSSNEKLSYSLEQERNLTISVSFKRVLPVPKCSAMIDGINIKLKIEHNKSEYSALLFDVAVAGTFVSNKSLLGYYINLVCKFGRKEITFDQEIKGKCRPGNDYLIIDKSFRILCNPNNMNEHSDVIPRWTMGSENGSKEVCSNTKCNHGYNTGEEGPYIYLQIDNFKESDLSNYTLWYGFASYVYNIERVTIDIYSYPSTTETIEYTLDKENYLTLSLSFKRVLPVPICSALLNDEKAKPKELNKTNRKQSENSNILFDVTFTGKINNKSLHGYNISVYCMFGRKKFEYRRRILKDTVMKDNKNSSWDIEYIIPMLIGFLFFVLVIACICHRKRILKSLMSFIKNKGKIDETNGDKRGNYVTVEMEASGDTKNIENLKKNENRLMKHSRRRGTRRRMQTTP